MVACQPGGLRRQHQTYFRLLRQRRRRGFPKGKAGPVSLPSQQRHFLPNDLAGALRRLDDVEIDALLAAVTTEAGRRGRRPPSPAKEKPVADAKPQRRQEVAEDNARSLTTGKLNAVRAALKAGGQAVRNRKAIWNFAIRCQEGTGAGHASRSLIWYRSSIIRSDREGDISGWPHTARN